ncbi:MAG: hypothetical protein KA712_08995 [Myxococcales bacterium]|nr:hypothetical protein [Myxococcales bacterium]
MQPQMKRRLLVMVSVPAVIAGGWLFLQCGGVERGMTPDEGPPGDRADGAAAQADATGRDALASMDAADPSGDASAGARAQSERPHPLARARQTRGRIGNVEALIPPQCYTKTDGASNPCWTCHTESRFPNLMSDWHLQKEYAFSEVGETNHWSNLFVDRSQCTSALSDETILAYVREDNYEPLRQALQDPVGYAGYRPDLDFAKGFDEGGFARDGSAWRAFRYKPFPGVFWPTNGATDDVMLRLPEPFRQRGGESNLEVYKANLAILEASFSSDPAVADKAITWPTENLDERLVGADLDGDGRRQIATKLVGLPSFYLGDAHAVPVRRSLYPQGTEFLHSVRYIDPDQPNLIARRMKELRYSKKLYDVERWKILSNYEREMNEREEGKPPVVQGDPLTGMVNDFGWLLQGFIEDGDGHLRLQTHEEQLFCMGCHTNLGVTLDQSFSFPRKVPGAAGWAYQDLRGIPDAPQLGHASPEILTYLRRVRGGDEFLANEEMLAKFVPGQQVNEAEVLRAAPGGDRSIADLLAPSRARALALDKAYRCLVEAQTFELGRDVVLKPATRIHRKIEATSTGLSEAGLVFTDGALRLDWRGAGFGL